jgi:hypothetical protein
MKTQKPSRSTKRVNLGICLSLNLTLASLAFSQLPDEVIVESTTRSISPLPGDFSFDVTRHTIPLREIRGGGPPKDGIPALVEPNFVSASNVRELRPRDQILGVHLAGDSKAYPVRILNWHELVNDQIGGRPILVTWCPLCGSGVVYDPVINGERVLFGVSGLLYQRNLLMYDRRTSSLWSQLGMQAVAGPLAGSSLPILPVEHTTWEDWRGRYPDTTVLSFQTGYSRDYDRDPYREMPMDRREGVAVFVGEVIKLYPLSELAKANQPIQDEVNGTRLHLDYDRKSRRLTIHDGSGESVRHFIAFLADLRAFYPDAERFQLPKNR